MTETHGPMQKNCPARRGQWAASFDTVQPRAYAMNHVVPVHQRRGVLLSPDAGVWVGISKRNSSHPPGERGWVLFSSAITRGKPAWADVSSMGEFKYTKIQGDSYDDCDRKRNLYRAENQ
jgi:hypothetical protein